MLAYTKLDCGCNLLLVNYDYYDYDVTTTMVLLYGVLCLGDMRLLAAADSDLC